MNINEYNELLDRGYDPVFLGPPPEENPTDTSTSAAPAGNGDPEKKGWIAQNPYRAAFVALAVIVVGGIVGLVTALGGGAEETPTSQGAPAGEVQSAPQGPAMPEVGATLSATPDAALDVWQVGVDVAPGVYERAGDGSCMWRVEDSNEVTLSSWTTSEDDFIAHVPDNAATFTSIGCGDWVRIG